MTGLVSGAIGVEITLQRGQTSYRLPAMSAFEGKQIISVSYCNANNVPRTSSGKTVFPLSSDRLELCLSDIHSGMKRKYSVADIENRLDQLPFNQTIDFRNSELVLINPDNPDIWHDTTVYLIFWYGINADNSQFSKSIILPLEVTINSPKIFFQPPLSLQNTHPVQLMLTFPGFTPSGRKAIDRSSVSDKFITLAGKDKMLFSQIPAYYFCQSHLKTPWFLDLPSIDFEKSSIISLKDDFSEAEVLFFNLMCV
ncbi:MAG: hypothetical protein H6Q19_1637 [Bacteroidetes bacterium]|nr:hypothetical protein [Bacteroidota bacterium]